MDPARDSLVLHASAVALNGRAAVLFGPSGSGKSSLALLLMAWGARLVADDGTLLHRRRDRLAASAPPATRGLIEARGVGLLGAVPVAGAAVALAVDMGRLEPARLPPQRSVSWLGVAIPLIFRVDAPHFAPAVFQMLKTGRQR